MADSHKHDVLTTQKNTLSNQKDKSQTKKTKVKTKRQMSRQKDKCFWFFENDAFKKTKARKNGGLSFCGFLPKNQKTKKPKNRSVPSLAGAVH